jgi:hypothetical protein
MTGGNGGLEPLGGVAYMPSHVTLILISTLGALCLAIGLLDEPDAAPTLSHAHHS